MLVPELRVFVNIVAATANLTTHGELLEAVLLKLPFSTGAVSVHTGGAVLKVSS